MRFPRRVGIREPDPADPVVFETADKKIAFVLAHGRDGGMGLAAGIPQRLGDGAAVVEFDYAAIIDPRAEPFVRRGLLDHPDAKAGIGHRQIIDGRAKADESKPVLAV